MRVDIEKTIQGCCNHSGMTQCKSEVGYFPLEKGEDEISDIRTIQSYCDVENKVRRSMRMCLQLPSGPQCCRSLREETP
jgi:hypothetical protein